MTSHRKEHLITAAERTEIKSYFKDLFRRIFSVGEQDTEHILIDDASICLHKSVSSDIPSAVVNILDNRVEGHVDGGDEGVKYRMTIDPSTIFLSDKNRYDVIFKELTKPKHLDPSLWRAFGSEKDAEPGLATVHVKPTTESNNTPLFDLTLDRFKEDRINIDEKQQRHEQLTTTESSRWFFLVVIHYIEFVKQSYTWVPSWVESELVQSSITKALIQHHGMALPPTQWRVDEQRPFIVRRESDELLLKDLRQVLGDPSALCKTITTSTTIVTPTTRLLTRKKPPPRLGTRVQTLFTLFFPIVLLQGAMGLGKTQAVIEWVKKLDADRRVRVLYVVPNRALVFSAYNRLCDAGLGFALYMEKGEVHTPDEMCKRDRLVICVNSLHKLENAQPFDVVVLDEIETLLAKIKPADDTLCHTMLRATMPLQMKQQQRRKGSPRLDQDRLIGTLWYVCSYSLQTIAMDAHPGKRAYDFLKRLSTVNTQTSMLIHTVRITRSATPSPTRKALIVKTYYDWLFRLLQMIREGKKVAVPMLSVEKAHLLERMLGRLCPDKRIQLYSSKQKDHEEIAHCNERWTAYDVLIYTPTISCGVDFNVAHFDVLFLYATSRSCVVRETIQMHGRVRIVKDALLVVYYHQPNNAEPRYHLTGPVAEKRDEPVLSTLIQEADAYGAVTVQQAFYEKMEEHLEQECTRNLYVTSTTFQSAKRYFEQADEQGCRGAQFNAVVWNEVERYLSRFYYPLMLMQALQEEGYEIEHRELVFNDCDKNENPDLMDCLYRCNGDGIIGKGIITTSIGPERGIKIHEAEAKEENRQEVIYSRIRWSKCDMNTGNAKDAVLRLMNQFDIPRQRIREADEDLLLRFFTKFDRVECVEQAMRHLRLLLHPLGELRQNARIRMDIDTKQYATKLYDAKRSAYLQQLCLRAQLLVFYASGMRPEPSMSLIEMAQIIQRETAVSHRGAAAAAPAAPDKEFEERLSRVHAELDRAVESVFLSVTIRTDHLAARLADPSTGSLQLLQSVQELCIIYWKGRHPTRSDLQIPTDARAFIQRLNALLCQMGLHTNDGKNRVDVGEKKKRGRKRKAEVAPEVEAEVAAEFEEKQHAQKRTRTQAREKRIEGKDVSTLELFRWLACSLSPKREMMQRMYKPSGIEMVNAYAARAVSILEKQQEQEQEQEQEHEENAISKEEIERLIGGDDDGDDDNDEEDRAMKRLKTAPEQNRIE